MDHGSKLVAVGPLAGRLTQPDCMSQQRACFMSLWYFDFRGGNMGLTHRELGSNAAAGVAVALIEPFVGNYVRPGCGGAQEDGPLEREEAFSAPSPP
jgi:hypothetical protein